MISPQALGQLVIYKAKSTGIQLQQSNTKHESHAYSFDCPVLYIMNHKKLAGKIFKPFIMTREGFYTKCEIRKQLGYTVR